MITFGRDGGKVTMTTETGVVTEDGAFNMLWTWATGNNQYAALLVEKLRTRFAERLQSIRREAYEEGYRAGRHHQPKRGFFSGNL